MKGFPRSPQPQRNPASRRGSDAQAMRGNRSKNKDRLKSDRDRTMSVKPANLDEFGSRHNQDARAKAAAQLHGQPKGGQDLSFRESSQDTRASKSRKHLTAFRGPGPKRTGKGHG